MKYLLATSILLISFTNIKSQGLSLPIVYAEGGKGKNVVYKKPTKQELEEMVGFVWGPCSNCIAMNDCNIHASSNLPTQGAVNYSAKNLQDDDPTTAWVEGDSEYGIGEYIESKNVKILTYLSFCNGYQKSPKSFIENSRVKSFRVSENGIDRCIIRLKDEMGVQSVSTEKLGLKFNSSDKPIKTIRFTIMEVYPGTKFKDVAISELFNGGCCVSGQSKIGLTNGQEKEIGDIKINDSIKLIDRNNNIIYAAATEIGSVMHSDILEIVTEKGRTIGVTAGHLMYAGSINNKVQAIQLKVGDTVFVVDDKEKIAAEKIASIEQINKPTQTFYFKKLNFGNQQINWPIRAIFNNIIATDEYLEKLNKMKSINK